MILRQLKNIIDDNSNVGIIFEEESGLPLIDTWRRWKENITEEGWSCKINKIYLNAYILIELKNED